MYGIDWKKMILCLAICLIAGMVSGLLTVNSPEVYGNLKLPDISPPGFLFPIVWTILYILMGISLYLIVESDAPMRKMGLMIFCAQLIVNFIWAPIFFTYGEYLLAFVLAVLLWILVAAMILTFMKIDRRAAYIQVPYLIWLVVACYLSYSVYVLN